MFCAFEGRPLILRLHGRGRVVEPGDADWDGLIAGFPEYPGVRSVVVMDVERIADSCGYAVPLYEYRGERTQLIAYAERKGPEDGGVQGPEEPGEHRRAGRAPDVRRTMRDERERPDDPVQGCRGRGGTRPRPCLFGSYAAEFAESIAEALCFQGFEAELAGLPGRYAPPSGCLLLAMEGDVPAGCVAMRRPGRRHLRDEAALRHRTLSRPGRREVARRGTHSQGRAGRISADGAGYRARDGRGHRAVPIASGSWRPHPTGMPDRADGLLREIPHGLTGIADRN